MSDTSLVSFFREYERDLSAFMLARLKCDFTVRDLLQELFMKVAAQDGGEIVNKRAYLYRMAANMVIDHQRYQQRQARLLDEVDAILYDTQTAETPEQSLINLQELERLAEVVEALSPTARLIFTLNRFDGMSQREIAARLGLSQTSVQKQIRKVLDRLANARLAL